jgi:death-on-curing protein
MSAPLFLTLDEILQIHEEMIAEEGGGDCGVRDLGLLESAIAQPHAGFGDEHFYKDLPHKAAAYLFHIVKNHPFITVTREQVWPPPLCS